jgi:hypothetical protein
MELRDYQLDIVRRGVAMLKEFGMVYLAMEVRTGKTATALSIAQEHGAQTVLFVTKKKAISSIEKDYLALPVTFAINVINYDKLHQIDGEKFDLIICDEAHGLGQFPLPNKRAKLLKTIVGIKPVIYLSGTPTPESWSQIYHQFWISSDNPFPETNFYRWAKNYVDVTKKYLYNKEVNDYTHARNEDIKAVCGHLFISFTQEEAGFEQVVEEEVLTIEMAAQTYEIAKRLKYDSVYVGKKSTVIADTAVKLMGKLHQVYSGTVIVDEPERKGIAIDNTKAKFIKGIFARHKIAIFYKFIAEREMLVNVFGDRIVDTPEEFNATGPDRIYISQIQSGREGINLSAADALVMMNIDFSAVSYWQARARMQSKDRDRPAKVYWIFAAGGIEEKIYLRVLKKKDYTLEHFKRDLDSETINHF